MAKTRITLVGLGAIGGSIGLALRQAEADLEIMGHDKEPGVSRQALKAGAVHKTDWNLVSACENADLVVLALPLSAIKDTLKAIAPYLRENCVITDTATVKDPVVKWAQEILPEKTHFVGGDPIVATDGSGIDAAKADLFKGMTWCLTPAATAVSEAIQLVADAVTLIGAKPYFVDPAEHDGLLAATDHLPLVLATALLRAVTSSPAFREMTKLGGPYLARITSPVVGDINTSRDLCLINKDNIVRWLDIMQAALRDVRDTVATGDETRVNALFEQAEENRTKWLKGEQEETSSPDYRELMSVRTMLFGRMPRLERPSKKR